MTLLDLTTTPPLPGTTLVAAINTNVAASLGSDFRLTLSSGTAVTTSDATAATTLYLTPFHGDVITLYDGSANWRSYRSAEISIAVPATTSTIYDVFVYASGGSPTLELLAWTNDTTRATALVVVNGRYCKSGSTTRLYVGSFRTTGTSGQTEDSAAKRYVWNYYNRVRRTLKVTESTSSWNYTTAAFRQANGAATNQIDAVVGVAEDTIEVSVFANATNSNGTSGINAAVGVGVDSTSSNSALVFGGGIGPTNYLDSLSAHYRAIPAAGRHFYAWLETSQAFGTTTWYGSTSSGGVPYQSGIFGSIFS